MDNLQHIENFLFSFLGTLCLFMAFLSLFIQHSSFKRKKAMFLIEFMAFVMLISDLLMNVYDGNPSGFGYWVVTITNFLVFFSLYFILYGMNYYLRTFVSANDGSYPKRLKLAVVISFVGEGLLIVSQYNDMYYSIDSNNSYHRGPLFLVSYICPILIYGIILSVIGKFRKNFPALIFSSLMFFAVLPVVGALIQAFCYGLTLFDMSIGVAAVAMFILSVADQNVYLRQIASTEKMTGLPNSYGLMEKIGKKIGMRTIGQYDAFYFDIVRMGLINRKYGNDVGDVLIVKYAATLQKQLLEDEVLGRLGGNYFVALIRKERAQEFLKLLSGVPITVDTAMGEETVTVSAVAGVYEIDLKAAGNITPPQVLSNVSMAVNIAKNILKKPYVFLTPELQNQMNEQRQTLEMIPKCMEAKEFVPYYQPKVNTATNTLSGAEALVRWFHDGQIIPPMKFIPLMEQNESICKLDFYMLEYVCNDIREWLDKGLKPPVISINFSRKNLGNPILAEAIYNVVKEHDVPLDLIQIEVTETVDEFPLSYLKGVVEALQRYGMTAAIDDFGTGSSSIRIMKDVPFNVLKIDKSFIDSTTEKDRKILGYIIAMAKSMDAGVITEGVEHEEQIKILEELGCAEIQGYYFDKPLPKEEFEKRLAHPNYK